MNKRGHHPSSFILHPSQADVVCFGMVTPAAVLVVDDMPPHNTGAVTRAVREFISDDAAIVACLLRGWDVRSGLIGTELGQDRRGRGVRRQLKKLGVAGEVRLRKGLITPFEVNISDKTGARTYFWQRDPAVLATLDTADLSLLDQARLLYVDWYDGDHILRPMEEANRLGVPVFLNLEYGHQDGRILDCYTRRATFVQAVTDAAQRGGDPMAVAQKLLAAGAQVALVTLAGEGCLVAQGDEAWRIYAPSVPVVDGCGAGATFSAGFIYGYLHGWEMEESARLATAAASLKCALIGPQTPPLEEVREVAAGLRVERMAVNGLRGAD